MEHSSDGMAVLRTVLRSVEIDPRWRERITTALSNGVGVHLAVFVEPFLEAILDGRKTMESRFGVHRCAPFDRVGAGDLILLKRSGGPVVGIAVAGRASFYKLDAAKLGDIRDRYAAQIFAEDDDFWNARAEKRFATLIEIEHVTPIETTSVQKKDRRGWVTYREGRQPCLVAGI